MIIFNGKSISQIYYGSKSIQIVKKGLDTVWQAIRSCFGSGYWINEKPWLNDEGWKN